MSEDYRVLAKEQLEVILKNLQEKAVAVSDARVVALVRTKIEEALLWLSKVENGI
jgi:hypothetical protein